MTRVRRNSPYAAIPNDAMRDESISIEARGMLALMMGMGDDWQFRSRDLMKRCGIGKDKYKRMIRELKDAGYLEVVAAQDERGHFSNYDYILHDVSGGLENRPSDEPTVGKQDHLRKPTLKKTNTKQTPKPPEGADDLFSEKKEEQTKPSESDGIEEGFSEFWNEIWPSHTRKTGKADCRKVYRSACEGKHPKADRIAPQDLNAATRRYIASVTDRQFLKGPLPWLRLPGWEPFIQSTGGKMDWSTLTDSQRRMLERGECPPSMQGPNGEPTALAQAYLSEVAR